MKKKFISLILIGTLIISALSGCGISSQDNTKTKAPSVKSDTKETDKNADMCYEAGRAYLYGLDGQEIDLEAAYTNFEKALNLGKTEANFYLALLYDWYHYPKQNYDKARAYYEAVEDDPRAQVSLGFLYYYGQNVEKDTARAQELFDDAIAKDCVEGYLGSGAIAKNNEDYDTAFECYNKVLKGEEQIYIASAMYNIGYMYYYGEGLEQDYAKAMEWYQKAANLSYPSAMDSIGYMYQSGKGVDQDHAKAIEWYQKAANLGNSSASGSIGYMYYCGEGVEQDYAKAMEWYQKAANLGNSNSINNIGYMYQHGKGVEQDYAKAMEWYQKAANLENLNAMNNIGYMYHFGEGVEQNYAKAMEWYQKAANLGNSNSMNSIGYMYENGQGVEKNLSKAQEWYDKAVAAQ